MKDNTATPAYALAVLAVDWAWGYRTTCPERDRGGVISAALRLIRDTGGDDGGLPQLEAWELYMRGAGRAERTVRDGLGIMRMLERHADKTANSSRPWTCPGSWPARRSGRHRGATTPENPAYSGRVFTHVSLCFRSAA
jgi:hypothetical protein